MTEWIEWKGSDIEGATMPVAKGTLVDVKLRDGDKCFGQVAGADIGDDNGDAACEISWWHHKRVPTVTDIVAYRLSEGV